MPLYILFTHVYTSNTVYPVNPYLSCVPMFTLVTLYSLYTLAYHVYPSNTVYPYISCVPMFTLVILYTLYTLIYPVYFFYMKSFFVKQFVVLIFLIT